jgi:pyruvate ferredoxin oxidoreductase beta subunit
MKLKREHYKNTKDLPLEEYVAPGSPLCSGCGGLTTLRQMHKVLGENVVIVNAAGCMSMLAVYPYTPLRSSWLYTTMASAAAGAQGIRDALDVLIRKGRMPQSEDLKVVVLAGDGSTYDMGMSATSGAIHRNLDFWYLCYDNEAYGNTGFQMSAASPLGAQTSTSTEGKRQAKKDIFEIWRAQNPPYVATVSSHEPVDLAEKVYRASQHFGPKLFLSLAVCPTGWGYDPAEGDAIAKLALETGIWPLKEAIHGIVRHTYKPSPFRPVEEYLKPQRRFQHLFEPTRDEATLSAIQENVNRYWENVDLDRESEAIACTKP